MFLKPLSWFVNSGVTLRQLELLAVEFSFGHLIQQLCSLTCGLYVRTYGGGEITCGEITCGEITCGEITCGEITCGEITYHVRTFWKDCVSLLFSFHSPTLSNASLGSRVGGII